MLILYNRERRGGVWLNTGVCHKGVIEHHLVKCVLVLRALWGKKMVLAISRK